MLISNVDYTRCKASKKTDNLSKINGLWNRCDPIWSRVHCNLQLWATFISSRDIKDPSVRSELQLQPTVWIIITLFHMYDKQIGISKIRASIQFISSVKERTLPLSWVLHWSGPDSQSNQIWPDPWGHSQTQLIIYNPYKLCYRFGFS